jgi:hypothetical protein
MALGVTAYSEAPFGAEASDVIAYPLGIVLTGLIGEVSNTGNANVTVTGIQATIINEGVVGGSSVSLSVTGSELTTFIGEEDINVGVPVTGIELSITNKTSTQDTLTAFGEAPFATLSPSTFNIPSVEVETTTGAGQLPSFLLQSTLGTFSVTADGNVSVVVTEHTMNTSVGDVSITGIANVQLTNFSGPKFSAEGNAALSTDQAKFGVSSLELDGTDDSVDSTTNLDLSSTDFTVDVWIRPNNVTGYKGIWQSGTSTTMQSYLLGNAVYWSVNPSTIITTAVTVNANEWTMLSYERQGNTHRIYKNGTLEDTATTGNKQDNGLFTIGKNGFGDFNGYIDEFRVSDIARYTGSSFTEPTSEFSVDSDTIALLHFDGADGSTDMINAVNEESLVLENNIGEETAFTDVAVSVTGQELTISIGEETIQANADVDVSGINITSFIGQVDQNTSYSVTGNDLTISLGNEGTIGNANVDATGTTLTSSVGSINITAWSEIDPGVSNTWTDVDLAA